MRCYVDGCDRQRERRDWCHRHYKRWLRHGDPTGSSQPQRLPAAPLYDAVRQRRPIISLGANRARLMHHSMRRGHVCLDWAEDVCDEIGVHPVDVWGADYQRACAEAA